MKTQNQPTEIISNNPIETTILLLGQKVTIPKVEQFDPIVAYIKNARQLEANVNTLLERGVSLRGLI